MWSCPWGFLRPAGCIHEIRLTIPRSDSSNCTERSNSGDEEASTETWRAALTSPRLLKKRLARVMRSLGRPADWPIGVKMTLAMVITALTPMLITAYYNHTGSVEQLSAAELQNLELLAGSTAGRGQDREYVGPKIVDDGGQSGHSIPRSEPSIGGAPGAAEVTVRGASTRRSRSS